MVLEIIYQTGSSLFKLEKQHPISGTYKQESLKDQSFLQAPILKYSFMQMTTLSKNFTPDGFKDIYQLNQAINFEIRNITACLKVNKLSLYVMKSQFMI